MADPTFNQFLSDAPGGSRFVYHVGLLMADRQKLDPWSQKWGKNALHYYAENIYRAYEEGKVILVQEKHHAAGIYVYYAIKRRFRPRASGPNARGQELFGSFSGPRSTRYPVKGRGVMRPNSDRA